MRTLRLISTTAAILLLGVCAVSAQGMKANETTIAAPPAAQQNAPPEKMAPAVKSDKLLTTDKSASTGAVAKGSAAANSSADTKTARTAHNGHRRHLAGRYEGGRNGPLYDSYRNDRGYRGCRDHGHRWTLGLWC